MLAIYTLGIASLRGVRHSALIYTHVSCSITRWHHQAAAQLMSWDGWAGVEDELLFVSISLQKTVTAYYF